MQLGQRQLQIVGLLEAGSYSFEALCRRISPDRIEDRRLIQAALLRLQRAGTVHMSGRRGRHGLVGAVVALAEPRPDVGPL